MGRCTRQRGDDHMIKSRNRKLTRVTSSNEGLRHMCVDLSDYDRYLNQIEFKHHTINTTECSKFIWPENPRWCRPPSWISENVNNSEWDRAICAKFGGQLHHGHAKMTHDQNSKPELFCVTSLLWWIKMYILNECREHNKFADVKAYKSSQLTNL